MNHPTIAQTKNSELYFGELEKALHPCYASRFPPLDDLQGHCINLVYAAQMLDTLPANFWKSIDPLHHNIFYLPMQVIEWGKMSERIPNMFRREAIGDSLMLREFDWSNDSCQDQAEQCARILSAYNYLKKYFEGVGLPEGVSEF